MNTLPIRIAMAAAAVVVAPSLAQEPSSSGAQLAAYVPRRISYDLPGEGDTKAIYQFDQMDDLMHDMVVHRGDACYLMSNLDGMCFPVALALSGVDAVAVAQVGTIRKVIMVGSAGGSIAEYDDIAGSVTTTPISGVPANITRLMAFPRFGTIFYVIYENTGGALSCGWIDVGSATPSITTLGQYTYPSGSALADWTLADYDNDGNVEVAALLEGGGDLATEGWELGVPGGGIGTVLVGSGQGGSIAGLRSGANNELAVVWDDGSNVLVTRVAPSSSSTVDYVTSWDVYLPSGSYAWSSLAVGDIDDEGAGGYDDLVLQVPTASGTHAFALLRSGNAFSDTGRRVLTGGGTTSVADGAANCFDSNNSSVLGINSGADYHFVADGELVMLTGINNATTLLPSTSQLSVLWTSDDYTDFIRDVAVTDDEIRLGVEFSYDYFAQMFVPTTPGTTIHGIVVEFVVWTQYRTEHPSNPAVEADAEQKLYFFLDTQLSLNPGQQIWEVRLPYPDVFPLAAEAHDHLDNYFVEARFHGIYASGGALHLQNRGPTHLFGYNSDSSRVSGPGFVNWYDHLRDISTPSNPSQPKDDETSNGNPHPNGKDPGIGVKKPDELGPVPPPLPPGTTLPPNPNPVRITVPWSD